MTSQADLNFEGLEATRNGRRAQLLSAWDVLKGDVPSLRLECKTFLLKVFEIGGETSLKKSFREIAVLYLEDDSKNADRAKRTVRYLRQIGLLKRAKQLYKRQVGTGSQDSNEYRIDWATVVRTLARRELASVAEDSQASEPTHIPGGVPVHGPIAPCDRPVAPCNRPVAGSDFTPQVTSSSFSSSDPSSSAASSGGAGAEMIPGSESGDASSPAKASASLAGAASSSTVEETQASLERAPEPPVAGKTWRDAEAVFVALRDRRGRALTSVASTLKSAAERGYGPSEVVALARWFEARKGAFRSIGALRSRLLEWPPGQPLDQGWPPMDEAGDEVTQKARQRERDVRKAVERIEDEICKRCNREGVEDDAEFKRRCLAALAAEGLDPKLSRWRQAAENGV